MTDPPSRTLGVAFSDGDRVSRVAGAVLRSDFALDGLAYGSCTVGGTDATDAVVDLTADLGREDVRHVCIAGVAPAWFNLLDLRRIHEALDRPLSAVSYEASPGLEPALREAFDGDALDARLERYRALPPRQPVAVGHRTDASEDDEEHDRAGGDAEDDAGDVVYVRALGVGDEHAAEVVRGFTHESGRPEPVRVAREVARAGDALRRSS